MSPTIVLCSKSQSFRNRTKRQNTTSECVFLSQSQDQKSGFNLSEKALYTDLKVENTYLRSPYFERAIFQASLVYFDIYCIISEPNKLNADRTFFRTFFRKICHKIKKIKCWVFMLGSHIGPLTGSKCGHALCQSASSAATCC